MTTKVIVDGTHRVASLDDTLARLHPHLDQIGVTRVAVITGLDTIGIPVVMVTRPNGRSLSVSQGKGTSIAAAKVSGIMEALEAWHAENILLPLRLATHAELRRVAHVVDVERLARRTHSRFHDDLSLLWVQGADLVSGASPWVPFELVHLDYRVPGPQGSGCFAATGSGLASGNHLLEAVSHGITELIERDSLTLWRHRDPDERQARRVSLESIDDEGCRALIDRFHAAGVLVAVWDLSTDIACPSFRATIIDADPDSARRLPGAAGFGCHVERGVALSRALTEAAQGRLTLIAGSRDDAPPSLYLEHRDPRALDALLKVVRDEPGDRLFSAAPTANFASIEEDVAYELDALRAVGLEQVVMVDLTRPETEIPVVRMVIPGLEGYADKVVDYQPGPRAIAVGARR